MAPTKTRLTAEEHIELGKTLADIRNDLQRRSVRVGNAYATTGEKGIPYRKLSAAVKALDEARNKLERAYFDEYPDTAEVWHYYPTAGRPPGAPE